MQTSDAAGSFTCAFQDVSECFSPVSRGGLWAFGRIILHKGRTRANSVRWPGNDFLIIGRMNAFKGGWSAKSVGSSSLSEIVPYVAYPFKGCG